MGSIPAGLHPDELAGVVGVLDVLTRHAPLRAFFDFRIMYLPLYGICEYLATLFFGYTAAAYRFPAAIFGVVTVWCTYGLTLRLTRDRMASLVAGACMAILPWDVVISRVGWEPAAMLPFVLGGLWSLRSGIDRRRANSILFAGLLFGIGSYSYRAALPMSAALALVLVACDAHRAGKAWRAIAGAVVVWVATIAPLLYSVATDPDFFWRDRRIATFAHGLNSHSWALFAHNYLAHFDFGALFRFGDGNLNHGPTFGVLYLWMLPWIIFGAIAVWQNYGIPLGSFLLFWLAIFPLGGALTNDGVPHFLRSAIGAPLACIFTAIGLVAAWRALGNTSLARFRTSLAALFAVVVLLEFSAFCRAYFIDYVCASADAYQFENRDLFATIRTLEPAAARVCFTDINEMNSLVLFGYYLRGTRLQLFERYSNACDRPRSLTVTPKPAHAPPGSRLVATVQKYDGSIADYVFLTR